MGVSSLPKTVTRQRRGSDLNPGPSAPESSTLTTRLLSHPGVSRMQENLFAARGLGCFQHSSRPLAGGEGAGCEVLRFAWLHVCLSVCLSVR